MTVRCPRRLAHAEVALHILDVVPPPDDRAKFTGWIANRAGYTSGYDCAVTVWRALDYLARRGLIERVTWPAEYSGSGARYWRKTQAGAKWEGTAAELARPRPARDRIVGR